MMNRLRNDLAEKRQAHRKEGEGYQMYGLRKAVFYLRKIARNSQLCQFEEKVAKHLNGQ